MRKSTLKYLHLTLKHKWFVFLAGRKIGTSMWRLIIHDWSKFLPSELPYYGRQFCGDAKDPEGYIQCWVKHQNRHDHHWEYHIPRTGCVGYKNNEPVQMSDEAILEMIADWMGASRAYAGRWAEKGKWKWFENHWARIRLHPETRRKVKNVLIKLELIGGEDNGD